MNDFNRSFGAPNTMAPTMDMSVDQGLRAFMLGIYSKLALGIAVSGAIAWAVGAIPALTALVFGTPLLYVVQFGPIALIFGSMFFMRNPSPVGSAVLYWTIVALIGAGLGIWVAAALGGDVLSSRAGTVYAPDILIIAKAFLITSSAFAALSLWGYTTKRDLSGIGVFMIMALMGVVVLSLLSLLFPPSGTFELIIQLAVLALSAGLIAWETQSLKEQYYAFAGDQRSLATLTNWGALNFFILFVNMFRIILSLLSSE
ncbi:MAG: Bax inhibitor-1/YccA family protein [Pseudomonadota bacterium]